MTDAERIVRVPLSIELIRRMDELVLAQTGGLRTRAEFIREAVEALVLELSYEAAPPVGELSRANEESVSNVSIVEKSNVDLTEGKRVWASLPELLLPTSCRLIKAPQAEVRDGPLFGLHNRDYPTIWAAMMLAHMTRDSLVPLTQFLADVTSAAWDFGRQLQAMPASGDRGLAALFPTNASKPQSAEEGFRAFALGKILQKGLSITASGPLFQWRLCQVEVFKDSLMVGVTEEGHRLLRRLEGITAVQPHSRDHASVFFHHLQRYSPEDLWGLKTVLEAVQDRAGRVELIAAFSTARPDWSDKEAASYAAGYVSRCREWGLLEPRQQQKLYRLSRFGEEVAEEWRGNG